MNNFMTGITCGVILVFIVTFFMAAFCDDPIPTFNGREEFFESGNAEINLICPGKTVIIQKEMKHLGGPVLTEFKIRCYVENPQINIKDNKPVEKPVKWNFIKE